MRPSPLLTLLSSLLIVLALSAPTARAERPYVRLEQRLSAEQLKATGLDRLAPEQLSALNALLEAERNTDVEAVRAEAKEEDRKQDREPVVSKIAGDFAGWSTSTRFTLANGQVWRVANTPDYYVPESKTVANPAVSITPGLFGSWYLQVEGHSVRAKVARVK